jgi:hypothetical protein
MGRVNVEDSVTVEDIPVMSYPRKNVEIIITGLEDQLNQHLVKLVGFEFPQETRQHFHAETEAWLDRIQTLRLKPRHRPGSFKFYYDLLFDYPFGGVELQNVNGMMELISRRYPGVRPTKTPEEMVAWLREFHTTLARRLSAGQSVLDMVPE